MRSPTWPGPSASYVNGHDARRRRRMACRVIPGARSRRSARLCSVRWRRGVADHDSSSHTLLVEIEDEHGRVGIGEAAPASGPPRAPSSWREAQRWNRDLQLGSARPRPRCRWARSGTPAHRQASIRAPQASRVTPLPRSTSRCTTLPADSSARPSFHCSEERAATHLPPTPRRSRSPRRHLPPPAPSPPPSLVFRTAVEIVFPAVKMEVLFGGPRL